MGRHKQWMFSTSFLKFQLWRLTICRNSLFVIHQEWHYYLITAKIMAQDILKLTYRFGKAYSKLDGWKLYCISSHPEFEQFFGKRADKRRKLYNGMIKCELYMYL